MKCILMILIASLAAGCDNRCIDVQKTSYDGELLENQWIAMQLSRPSAYRYNFETKKQEPIRYEPVTVLTMTDFDSGGEYCALQGDDEPWIATAWVMSDDAPCLDAWIDTCEPEPDDPQIVVPFTFLREGVTSLEITIPAAAPR